MELVITLQARAEPACRAGASRIRRGRCGAPPGPADLAAALELDGPRPSAPWVPVEGRCGTRYMPMRRGGCPSVARAE